MDTSQILKAFGIVSPCISSTLLPEGHLHETYRVETADGTYILQKMRHDDPAAVMENIARLSAHVRGRSGVRIPQYFCTSEGWLYRGCCRLMDCIPGEPLTAASSPAQTETAGFAVGRFEASLHGLEGLREVWQGLHNTRAYLEKLHSLCLPEEYTALHRTAVTIGEAACGLYDRQRSGLLPLRIIHGDARAANLLLCGDEAAVIDLDTVGKGLVAYDYGDGIRSAAQQDGVLDKKRFRAFTRGFLRGMPLLTEQEIGSLIPGIYCISAELAMRYLIDLAEGCTYFRRTPEQTAARAKELLTFAFAVLEQENELQGEVQMLRQSQ